VASQPQFWFCPFLLLLAVSKGRINGRLEDDWRPIGPDSITDTHISQRPALSAETHFAGQGFYVIP